MNVNDRIALEIGRAVLARIVAEAQRDEALAKLAETPTRKESDERDFARC